MANIIGVRFKKAGKIYFFDPDGKRKLENQRDYSNFDFRKLYANNF